jgi:hypothetical protein
MQIGTQPYPFKDLSKYYFADKDEGESVQYYGATDVSGAWYILRVSGNQTGRYAAGREDYVTNWENRTLLSYAYLFECTLY